MGAVSTSRLQENENNLESIQPEYFVVSKGFAKLTIFVPQASPPT
jgi:hypothetical protein